MSQKKSTKEGPVVPKKTNKRRIFLLILIVLALGGITGYFYLTHSLERRLQEKITASGLVLTYSSLDWHLFPPGISMEKARLVPAKSDSIFAVTMEHAAVDIALSDIFSGDFQHFSDLVLKDGSITVYNLDSLKALSNKDTLQSPKPKKDWKINKLDLRNIVVSVAGEKGYQLKLESFSGSLLAEFVDSSYQFGILKRPINMVVTDCHINTLFQYHGFEADTLTYNMKTQQLRCAGIHIYPKVSRDFLHEAEPFIAVHAELTATDLVGTGVEWRHTDHLQWHARKIQMNNPVFTAFQDKEKPFKPGERPMPPAWIENVPFIFMIDTVEFTNAALDYVFTRADAPVQGKLSLGKWQLRWLGYGNDETRGETFSAYTKMQWMGGPWLTARVTFPYDDPDYSFQIDGHFSEGDFARFNSVMEAAEGFHFVTGHCNSLRFSFHGNDKYIAGKLWINYEDVKIGLSDVPKVTAKAEVKVNHKGEVKVNSKGEIKVNSKGEVKVKHKDRDKADAKEDDKALAKDDKAKDDKAKTPGKDDEDPKIKGQAFKTFVANTLLIRTSTGGEVREVEVNAPRNPQQSVISLWLRGIMTGLKDALMR